MPPRLLPAAFIALIAFALHLLAVFPLALAQDPTFGDVKDTHKNFTAIEYLVSIGTLQGYDDGKFKPGKTINRAEMMKVLVAGQGLDPDAAQYKGCFPDVGEEWFARFVCYAKEQEWVEGYPDDTFKPANPINKVESIKMLVNALGLAGRLPETVTETLFNDTDSGEWYARYIKVAKDLGLLEETGSTFNPTGEKNRGGVAENIFRTLVVKSMAFGFPFTDESGESFLVATNQLKPGNAMTFEEAENFCAEQGKQLSNSALLSSMKSDPPGVAYGTYWKFDPDTYVFLDEQSAGIIDFRELSFMFEARPKSEQHLVYCVSAGEEEAAHEKTLNDLKEWEDTLTPVNANKSFNITAKQWSFDPAVITVNKGDTVLLHIQSVDVTHGFAITEFNVNSSLTAGQTTDVEFVADQSGTFSFFCSIFCGSGHSDMQGTLIVEDRVP